MSSRGAQPCGSGGRALSLAVLGLAWACLPLVSAQQDGEAADPAPAEAAPGGPLGDLAPAPGHETEAETVRRCLVDVRSPDVRLRRRAVLILGKYRVPSASAAVVACLRDEDDEVRRSAAVAVSEWDVLPQPAQSEVLRLIGDPSVHVRRVASSMLPEILGGRFGFGEAVVLSEEGPLISGPARVPAGEVAEGLNRALTDEDLTVRRNVLTAARYVPGLLRREVLEPCLRDADREVRVLAIQAYAQLRGEEAARGDVLAAAAADPDSTIRRETAQALGRLGAAGFAGLERLAGDDDPSVRVRAVRELVQRQHPRGLELIERTAVDEAIPAEERRGLLVYAGFYGNGARPLLTRLSTDRSALLRAEALRGLARLTGAEGGGPEFLLPCLTDESVDVRRTAVQALTRWVATRRGNRDAQAWPSPDDLRGLLGSAYPDVRLLAVRLASALEPGPRLETLTDACLDDEPEVRCEAIRSLAMLAEPEALALVSRSLDDPRSDVVLAAVQALALRPTEQSRQVLQAFHDRCADASLKASVAAVLAGLSGGPVQVRPQRWPVGRSTPVKPPPLRLPPALRRQIPGPLTPTPP